MPIYVGRNVYVGSGTHLPLSRVVSPYEAVRDNLNVSVNFHVL